MKKNIFADSLYERMAGNVEKTQGKPIRRKKHNIRWKLILFLAIAVVAIGYFLFY
jgi:hypothetical protein